MKLSKKEKKKFEMYVKANMRKGYFAALAFLGNHDDAMEISQKAFIKAFGHFKKFDRSKNFFAWYYTILRNLCLNHIRDNKKKKPLDEIIISKENTEAVNPQTAVENEELKNQLHKALFNLDEEDREILILREFENYSYKQLSELLGIPEGTVMSRLYYARKKLAKELKKYLK